MKRINEFNLTIIQEDVELEDVLLVNAISEFLFKRYGVHEYLVSLKHFGGNYNEIHANASHENKRKTNEAPETKKEV